MVLPYYLFTHLADNLYCLYLNYWSCHAALGKSLYLSYHIKSTFPNGRREQGWPPFRCKRNCMVESCSEVLNIFKRKKTVETDLWYFGATISPPDVYPYANFQCKVNIASDMEGHPSMFFPYNYQAVTNFSGNISWKDLQDLDAYRGNIIFSAFLMSHWATPCHQGNQPLTLTLLPKQLILASDPKLLEEQTLILNCWHQLHFFRVLRCELWHGWKSWGTQRNLCTNTTNHMLPPCIWMWLHRVYSLHMLLY